VTETKDQSSGGPLLRSPSAATMGARSAGAMVWQFLRWFFLGSFSRDLGDRGLDASAAVSRARQAIKLFVLLRVVFVLLVFALVGWAMRQPVQAVALASVGLAIAALWFGARAAARRFLLDAALRPIAHAPALAEGSITAWRLLPGRALQTLAVATDLARRGHVVEASRLAAAVDEGFLEPDERKLLVGIRAIIADREGDGRRAVTLALSAFPVGAPDIDERLGRIFAAGAWHDATRLARAYESWRDAGYDAAIGTPVGRLLCLVDLKLGRAEPPADREEAEMLAEEARALGDRELADRALAVVRERPPKRYR
jgi:hypothetical protein